MTASFENAEQLSTRPAQHAKLNTENLELLKRLDDYSAPFLCEKLMATGKMNSVEEYDKVFSEFKKFCALTRIYPNQVMGMISEKVDEVWHQFILFTKEYEVFGRDVLGAFLHHVPKTSFTPIPGNSSSNFFKCYNEVFGDLPPIWGTRDLDRYTAEMGCGASASCDGCNGVGSTDWR